MSAAIHLAYLQPGVLVIKKVHVIGMCTFSLYVLVASQGPHTAETAAAVTTGASPLRVFFGSRGRPGLLTPSPNLSFTNWKNCRGCFTAAADRFTHSVRSRAGTAFSTASTNSAVAKYLCAPNILTSSANRANSRYRVSRRPLSPSRTGPYP